MTAPEAEAAGADIRVVALPSADPLQSPWLGRELVEKYLIFDAFVAGERRVDLHPLLLSPRLHAAAMQAATAVVRAIGAVAALAHADAAERERYGLPASVMRLAAAAHAAGDDAALMRVDLLLGADGRFRACELNADCPGGHNEATGLPRLAQSAGFWQGLNPTTVLAELTARLAALADRPGPGRGTVALLYATAYAEDLQVCALIERALRERGVHTRRCPATAPRWQGDAVYVGPTPVAALYRFFPMEYMDGQRNLEGLIAAVASRRLKTLSSFSHIYSQSKLAFARGWALRDRLAPADALALAEHTPQSCEFAELPAQQLQAERAQWVLKRALGRVGDEVFVGALLTDEDWASLCAAVQAAVTGPAQERWIAQRFVPQKAIATPFGEMLVTLGVYVLDGRFVGYFARLSPQSHVSHDALCLPVFVGLPEPAARSEVPLGPAPHTARSSGPEPSPGEDR